METPKAPEFVPQSRGPSDVERQDPSGAPPPTDKGVQRQVEKTVEEGSGGA